MSRPYTFRKVKNINTQCRPCSVFSLTNSKIIIKSHTKYVLLIRCIMPPIPPIIIRFLMSVYKLQIANVKWNGEISTSFKISYGVKQGAVLSSILYCVYMNDLFTVLKKKKYGCWITVNITE